MTMNLRFYVEERKKLKVYFGLDVRIATPVPSVSVVYRSTVMPVHCSFRPLGHETCTSRAREPVVPRPTSTRGSLADA
jgi:hypothetical protein